jgi:hypothetical protein
VRRILLVAPDTKEPRITADQQRLLRDLGSMGVSMLPLLGDVTVDEVITRLGDGSFDVVVFMAHSFGAGIQLVPGQVLEPAQLGSVARFGLRLVVLLACESYAIAQAVCEAAGVDVIATILPLESSVAWQTGSLLVRALLTKGATHQQAYEQAVPAGNRDFIFLAALRKTMDMDESNLTATVARHGAKIDEHERRLADHDDQIEAIQNKGVLKVNTEVVAGIAVAVLFVFSLVLLVMLLAERGG